MLLPSGTDPVFDNCEEQYRKPSMPTSSMKPPKFRMLFPLEAGLPPLEEGRGPLGLVRGFEGDGLQGRFVPEAGRERHLARRVEGPLGEAHRERPQLQDP